MEEDLLAGYFLGMFGAMTGKDEEFVCHLRGFVSILRILERSYTSADLVILWPIARRQFAMFGSGVSHEIMVQFRQESRQVLGPPTMRQTQKYCHFWADTMGVVENREVWGVIDSLFQIYLMLRRCLRLAAVSQSNNRPGLRVDAASLLTDVKDVLIPSAEVYVEKYEKLLKDHLRKGSPVWCIEAYEATFLYHTICLLVTLLESPSILDAFSTSFTPALAIASLAKHLYPVYTYPTHEWLYPQIISCCWIAGLAFSWDEFPECI